MPNTALAQHMKNTLKAQGILVGTDGPFDNVLKIKPPLSITQKNVDEFIKMFSLILNN